MQKDKIPSYVLMHLFYHSPGQRLVGMDDFQVIFQTVFLQCKCKQNVQCKCK